MKKYIVLTVTAAALLGAGLVFAETNCDTQPKPAFECPAGYTMMCISAGEDHWGCGKKTNGLLIEVEGQGSSSAGAGGIRGTVQGEAEVSGSATPSSKDWDNGEGEERAEDHRVEKVEVTTQGETTVSVPAQAAAKINVSGWDPEKKESIEGKVKMQSAKNTAIKSVEITESNVNVVYATKGKLFAIIPITMNINVSSDTEGKVKVKFPWYRFLVATSFANAETKLNAVFQNNQTDMDFLKARGSAEAQAGIFVAIADELEDLE